jgi:glycosyltransferase involved in cell wall biosynthesis
MYKILNIISDRNIGGAGKCLINMAKYYDKEQFLMETVVPAGSALISELRAFGMKVYEADAIDNRSFSFGDVKVLKKLIKTIGPDLVHTHGALSGRIAAKQLGIPVVYTRHSVFDVNPKLKKGIGRFLNKRINEHYADAIIAVTEAAKKNLTDGGISPGLIIPMDNGVDPVERRSEDEVAAFKKKWNISGDDFVMAIMARIEPYKGHLLLVEAAAELADEGRKFKLIVAGTGNFEAEVKKQVADRGLAEYIILLGFTKEVPLILSAIDVQMNASYGTEASSIALLEGFSMGVPVIASDYGGNPYSIDDGEDGLLFESRNAKDLAAKIRLMMDDPALRERLGRQAKEIYLRRFTGGIYARNVAAVYKKVLEGRLYAK